MLKKHHGKIYLWVILVIFLIFAVIYFYHKNTQNRMISPLSSHENSSSSSIFSIFNKQPKKISEVIPQIKDIIDKQKGSYSVYIVDLTTKENAGINENTIFTGASLNKIYILATLYNEASKNNLDLDERVTILPEDIQDYGTGVIRNEGPGEVYSLKTLAQLMMEKSDNTAAYILMQKVTLDKVKTLLTNFDLVQTDMENNKTSNTDVAKLMQLIWNGKITNDASTKEMLDFMNGSDFENRLLALLPQDVKVYHKIGTENRIINDAGIVDLKNQPYYIGVLSNDIVDEAEAEKTIAQISRVVYDFMNKR